VEEGEVGHTEAVREWDEEATGALENDTLVSLYDALRRGIDPAEVHFAPFGSGGHRGGSRECELLGTNLEEVTGESSCAPQCSCIGWPIGRYTGFYRFEDPDIAPSRPQAPYDLAGDQCLTHAGIGAGDEEPYRHGVIVHHSRS
jgi:hypothetical protein